MRPSSWTLATAAVRYGLLQEVSQVLSTVGWGLPHALAARNVALHQQLPRQQERRKTPKLESLRCFAEGYACGHSRRARSSRKDESQGWGNLPLQLTSKNDAESIVVRLTPHAELCPAANRPPGGCQVLPFVLAMEANHLLATHDVLVAAVIAKPPEIRLPCMRTRLVLLLHLSPSLGQPRLERHIPGLDFGRR